MSILLSQTLEAIPVDKFYKHMYQEVISSGQDEENCLKTYDRVLEGKADADVTQEDEVLRYRGRLWVPDSVDLRKMLLQEQYDSKVAGHISQEKTIELVWNNFFRPNIDSWNEN